MLFQFSKGSQNGFYRKWPAKQGTKDEIKPRISKPVSNYLKRRAWFGFAYPTFSWACSIGRIVSRCSFLISATRF